MLQDPPIRNPQLCRYGPVPGAEELPASNLHSANAEWGPFQPFQGVGKATTKLDSVCQRERRRPQQEPQAQGARISLCIGEALRDRSRPMDALRLREQ